MDAVRSDSADRSGESGLAAPLDDDFHPRYFFLLLIGHQCMLASLAFRPGADSDPRALVFLPRHARLGNQSPFRPPGCLAAGLSAPLEPVYHHLRPGRLPRHAGHDLLRILHGEILRFPPEAAAGRRPEGYRKKPALLPAGDHVDGLVLCLESLRGVPGPLFHQ